MAITKRGTKGSALTIAEHDTNIDEFIARSNHIGTQTASTISDFSAATKAVLSSSYHTIASSSSITVLKSNGLNQQTILTSNTTISFSGFSDGDRIDLLIIQNSTGSWTLTLPAGTKVSGGNINLQLSLSPNSQDLLIIRLIGSVYYVQVVQDFA